jgi:protein-disulfide isomerase
LSETDKREAGGGVKRAWPLFVGLSLIVALAVAAVLLSGDRPQPTAQEQEDRPAGAGREEASQNGAELGHPSLGDADAPVVMIEYGDFRCAFCGKFAREVEPQLVDKYVESGTLRMKWRDFPYLGQESVNAALAARAAQDQGKFWEFHDLLFDKQDAIPTANFADHAKALGLDVATFQACIDARKHREKVERNYDAGVKAGVSGTPAFFINGRLLSGGQPFEAFKAVIDEELERLGLQAQR